MTPNAEQRAAIESTAAVTVVAAGPGSGKTQTLVERVRTRVAAGVDPKRIIVLTFTNAGAHVFVERLKPIVVKFAGTLHGFGIRLIQKVGGEIGYRAGSVSIVTKETQEALLLATAKRLGLDKKVSKRELLDATPTSRQTPVVNMVWAEYQHELKRSNMIDYDGILVATLRILRDVVCDQCDELYVDERQDSAAIDVECFEAIGGSQFHVGDIDQSIFAFRGAEPRLFLELARRHSDSTYVLTHNYRSDIAICEAATRLIAHNSDRILKPVVAVSKERGNVRIVEVPNDTAEIFEAYNLIGTSGYTFGSSAILCRTNAIADRFRTMLRGFGVAVRESRGRRLPEDWSLALSAIGLLIDPSNDHHAEQVMSARGKAVGERDYVAKIQILKLAALKQGAPLIAMTRMGERFPVATLDGGLAVLQSLGVSDESMELIRQRVAVLPNPEPTLSDLLADLWNNDKWNVEDEGDGVTVSTIHQAKGKEWDFVLVPAMEEGILPSSQALKTLDTGDMVAAIEEERRLCFVAITRARHQLVLMHARQRTAFGKTTNQEPSRFLQEIK